MVQGVSSDAGKSLLTTALCAWSHRRGIRAVPFKAQNMSNNARIVDGGEIGSAQWLQALAAGVHPDVRMNPVLLKPESEIRSQVVLNGIVSEELTSMPWRGRSARLWPHVTAALTSLTDEFDVVVIEGAGSPAETNLWSDDISNMAVAEAADAPVLLVADIDRGGAFAHLYGTWALLPPSWQARIEGFVLNKFRGDPDLLAPAPDDLGAVTGVPTVGVLPWLDHGLPDEEGPTPIAGPGRGRQVSIVCGPCASNLDEFAQLQQVADVGWVRAAGQIGHPDLIILPGSKHVAHDLDWLRRTGLATAVTRAAHDGTPVLGVCGGLQMLGRRIDDPDDVEGAAVGLGLLPLETRYRTPKRTARSSARFGPMAPPWSWLGAREVSGYEIHHGTTRALGPVEVVPGGLAFGAANVMGLYLHGLFEDPAVLEAFCGQVPPLLRSTFEQLADAVEEHLDTGWIRSRLGGAGNGPSSGLIGRLDPSRI
ncbi:MAG: cobyric acid synthase [Acidimicrobiales bacterium]